MTQLKIIAGLLMGCSLLTTPSYADIFDNNYVLLAPQYADVDIDDANASEAGFNVAFGTEIHRQWYAEIGYNQFSSNFEFSAVPTTTAVDGFDPGVDASGLYIAVLGKASGQSGELFYRLGVMNVGYETSTRLSGTAACNNGTQSFFTVSGTETVTQCDIDDSGVAGMIGAGFDFYVGYSAQVRLQFEHVRGSNDVQANTAQLGFRYNF